MDKDFYIQLIQKQLTGELSEEEDEQLGAYLSSDVEHQQLSDEIRLSWELGAPMQNIPEVDVDQELNRIHLRITSDSQKRNIETSLSESPIVKPIGKVRFLVPRYLAVAASIIALISGGVWLFNSGGIDGIDNIKTIAATNGTKIINLTDGSKIWLREGGMVKYAKDQTREISLVGQAFFEVARDEIDPFLVSIDETLVTVLGTSFSIGGSEDGTIELQVATGRVSMSNEYDEIVLEKGNAAAYRPSDQKIKQVDFRDPIQEPWKSGRFVFKEESLGFIINELEEYYSVQIELSNNTLSTCKKTTSIPVKTISEVIQSIATQFQLSVRTIADTSFVLDGDQCQ
ncbi:MAG: transmembrane sensor [Saprospiraceae bacterium]|jgi:transmembrane sensor